MKIEFEINTKTFTAKRLFLFGIALFVLGFIMEAISPNSFATLHSDGHYWFTAYGFWLVATPIFSGTFISLIVWISTWSGFE